MADPRRDFILLAAPGATRGFDEFGVPASVTIAQAILESNWGRAHIGRANNYFGIKAQSPTRFGSIATGVVRVPTKEVVGGRTITGNAVFRAYRSIDDSMRDHARFLRESPRYRAAFAHSADANAFARAIHRAGYATDPRYADKVITLMRTWDLYSFDRVARPRAVADRATAEARARGYIARLQRDLNRHLAAIGSGRRLAVNGRWSPETETAFEQICRILGIEPTRTISTFRRIAGGARTGGQRWAAVKPKLAARPDRQDHARGGGLAGDGDTDY